MEGCPCTQCVLQCASSLRASAGTAPAAAPPPAATAAAAAAAAAHQPAPGQQMVRLPCRTKQQ